MKTSLLVLFALMATGSMRGQTATVSFAFERVGVPVPKFTLRIGEDGMGRYVGEESAPKSPYPGVSTPASPIEREFNISAATTHKVFELAHDAGHFNIVCASKAKNIADTGTKTLSYKGPEGEGSCTYNYSENKSVVQLTDILQGIAATMDYGRQLDHLHRFDRLGLDAAMEFLTKQAADGHAVELGTIQTTLKSIAADPQLIGRVRLRANALLAQIPAK